MEFEINYLAVLVSAIIAMIVGVIWYGPLFGKKWMEVLCVNPEDKVAREIMKKESKSLYLIQLIITIFQVWVLAALMNGWSDFDTPKNILWIWAGFVAPTIAGSAMWNNNSKKVKWTQFFIQGGYQLVIFIIFGFILTTWK